jgi:hypothetical protein
MGFWSKLAGIGLGAAGVVTGNPGLIIAGGTMIAGDMSKDATNKAVSQQQQATDKALGVQQGMYQQNRADLSPFMSLGTGAAGMLGHGLGLSAPSAGPIGTTSGVIPGMSSLMTPQTAVPKPGATEEQAALGRRPNPGTVMSEAQQQTASGYQRMHTPTGQTVMVPPNMVQQALQRGGRMA